MFEIVQLFFLQPTASASWPSDGRLMILQPEPSILTQNQEKEEPFLGLTDRFLYRENVLQALPMWNFQPGGYKNQDFRLSF